MTEITRHQAGGLIMDMSLVEFVDSSGLGALVSVLKALGTPSSVELTNLQPRVRTMLKLTRMDQVFVIREAPTAEG